MRRLRRTSNPVRSCAGCGRRVPQGELLRFHEEDGQLVSGAGPGRGAYTCHRRVCFERAVAHRAFSRILRRTVRTSPELDRLYTDT